MQTNIIFDLGKVIIDFSWERTIENIRSRLPSDYALDFSDFVKHEDLFRYERGQIDTLTYCESMSRELAGKVTALEFQEAFNSIFIGVIDGVDILLDELKKSHKIVALTNINLLHYDFIIKNYSRTLDKFQKIYASHELGCRKPEEKIYELVLADMHTTAAQCIYLDDMVDNIHAAQHLGFRCIHVQNPAQMHSDLQDELRWNTI